MTLKYVITMYLVTQHSGLLEAELVEVRALRLSGYYSNPSIKYAFVIGDASVKAVVEQSVIYGHTLHATKVFHSYEDAVYWVSGKALPSHTTGLMSPCKFSSSSN